MAVIKEDKGDAGADELYGNGDDDVLEGGAGDDRLHGGAVADLDGGEGTDLVEYWSSDAGVRVNLKEGTAGGGRKGINSGW